MTHNCGKRGRKSGRVITDRSGETLMEVLVAILVSLLSVMVFAVSVVKASRMIRDSREALRDYYNGNNAIVSGTQPAADGEVTVIFDGIRVSVPVQYYTNTESAGTPVVCYHPADDSANGNGG